MTEYIFKGPDVSSIDDAKKITSYEIPNNFTSIGDHAFECFSNLEKIIIPDTITKIGNNARFLPCQ